MSLRRAGFLALALVLAAGCREVSKRAPAQTVYLAAFDPATGTVPLPNDLALEQAPNLPTGIQRDVLFTYVGGGGWPGDQVIDIPIRTLTYDAATNAYLPSDTPAPGIEAATVNAHTVAIVRVSDSPPTVLTPQLLGYGPDSVNPAIGVLRIRPVEGLAVGRYAVAVRGGSHGVKTTDHQPISPDQVIALIAPGKDLSNPENRPSGVTLSPAQLAQLEALQGLYAFGLPWGRVTSIPTCQAAIPTADPIAEGGCWLPSPVPLPGLTDAFTGINLVFPHGDAASLQTFNVAAPAVVADTSAGVIPFPSDFMLDPTSHLVRNIPALGQAAPGLATLDGFSTTGLMLAPLSAPVNASTLGDGHVLFYDLEGGGLRRMHAVGESSPEFLLEPPSLVSNVGGLDVTTAIGLQPAYPIPAGDSIIPLPPLKPKNRYLVVITNGVTDVAGHPLVRGTLGNLLLSSLSTEPYSGGHSNVPGVSDTDAAALEQLRVGLRTLILPALTGMGDIGSPDDVVMAYTVTTQDVKTVSGQLTALPYKVDAIPGMGLRTSAPTVFDATAAPYGIPSAATPHVKEFLSTTVTSLDILDPLTGALNPSLLGVLAGDPATWDTDAVAAVTAARHEVPVLVAVPDGVTCGSPPCPVPLVVFHHGIFGSRFQMLGVADALAAEGFVVAAIDAPFHGDRAFCETSSDCNGGTCTLDAANLAAPGTCSGGLAFDSTRLTTVASGNYFISPNFFRIRDVVREDLFDQSALVQAVARPPLGDPSTFEPLTQQLMGADGMYVDPTRVYFAGMSLGGMIGTSMVATNPRISRAGLNVAGGTLTDIFTNSPSFQSQLTPLFSQLIPGFTLEKVTPGNPAFDPVVAQEFAQTLIVGKWILDPAESINYAADMTDKGAADPTLLGGLMEVGIGFDHTDVYGQLVQDDQVVPNGFSLLLYEDADIPFTLYTADVATLPNDQRHGVLLAPTAEGATVRGDLASFLESLTVPAANPKPLP